MRPSLLSLALIANSAIATPSLAADLGGGFSVSGNAALVTDYRFRGISFSDEDIAIQGGLDLAHTSGFYLGTWGSSLDEGDSFDQLTGDEIGTFGHTEIDVYGGWTGEVSSGVSVDVGVLYYIYPNANNSPRIGGREVDFDTDYVEPYASISYSIGPARLTTGIAYAPDQSAIGSDDNVYVYGDAGIGIPNTPLTVRGHLGYTNGSLAIDADGDYFDWLLGVDYIIGPVTIGAAYIDTDGPNIDNIDATVVGTLSIAF